MFSAQKTRDSLVTPFLRPKASSKPSASLLPGSQALPMGANRALAQPPKDRGHLTLQLASGPAACPSAPPGSARSSGEPG